MKQPLVSVIVPNYNHAPFLTERLDSILGQTYTRFELIILDDCSTDDSRRVIEQYRDRPQVSHIVLNHENSGSPFVQWERGLELAKGELVWIAESDDTCRPDFLERMVAEFEQQPDVVLSFCRSVKIDTEGRRLSEEDFPGPGIIDGRAFVRRYLSRYNYIVNASSAVFARRTLDAVDRTYTQYRGCGDWLFWVEIAKSGHVAYIDEPLNCFRQHGSNTTAQQTRTGKGETEVARATDFLRRKAYIHAADYFRAQVVHVYSVRHGKLSRVLEKDVVRDIVELWHPGFMARLTVASLKLLDRLGISLVHR